MEQNLKIMKTRKTFLKLLIGLGISSILLLGSCTQEPLEDDNGNKNPNGDKPSIELCELIKEEGDIILESDADRPVDYSVDCHAKIEGRKIIIEAGTVIEFTESGLLSIVGIGSDNSAAIIAKGNPDNMIVFKGSRKEKGHWGGIYVRSKSELNEFNYVVIRDAGKEEYLKMHGALSVDRESWAKIRNSKFVNNKKYGLDISRFYKNNDPLIIENNIFEENGTSVQVNTLNIHNLDLSNQFIDNEKEEIHVALASDGNSQTLYDRTWHNHGIPYVFMPGPKVIIGSKITIEPGTILKFHEGQELLITGTRVGNKGTGGGIIAKGTAEKPIVFTGIEKRNRYWKGIHFNATSYVNNEISHAIIEYTGIISSYPNEVFNVFVARDSYSKFDNIQFKNSNHAECAIWEEKQGENHQAVVEYSNISVEEGQCVYSFHEKE